MSKETTSATTDPGSDGIVRVTLRDKAALHAAYMPFLDGGGLFVPSKRAASLGEEVRLSMQLLDDLQPLVVTGKVAWLTPAGTPGRQQGFGVQFARDEAGARARERIETLLGAVQASSRPTHTI